MFAKLVGLVFVIVLVVGVPALSFLTLRELRLRRVPRLSLYLSAVFSQWLLAILGILAVFGSRQRIAALGFRSVSFQICVFWGLGLTVVSVAAMGFSLLLERWGWWPRESDLVQLLIPVTRREKFWALCVLAPTAALCEEFLYRGFLLSQLAQGFKSVAWGWAASSLAFGLAHTYQGWSGVLRAALLGGLLACPVVRLGSLYPSMLAHALIDALALAWLGPRFVRTNSAS